MAKLAAAIGPIVDMQHHPFGNSYFPTAACGGGPYDADVRHCFEKRCAGIDNPPADCFAANVSSIIAQHGHQEYEFNRVQACAKDITVAQGEAWYSRYWTFAKCVEDHYDEGIGCSKACAVTANFTNTESDYVQKCLTTSAGDASVIREAKATIDHIGTPTVIVAGKTSDPDSALADVCAAYTGPEPAGCIGVRKGQCI